MFRAKTLFVLGAGSSAEVGLPTGQELKLQIAQSLNLQVDSLGRHVSGDSDIYRALVQSDQEKRHGYSAVLSPYLEAARTIVNALPLSISIDNLLDAHRGDHLALLCGKLGIVKSILAAEGSSKLYCANQNNLIDFSSIENTWFSSFFKLLTEDVPRAAVGNIFDNVSFINFNYDRSLETYLYEALQMYYKLDPALAGSLLDRLTVLRPYGSIGRLEWQKSGDETTVPYGRKDFNLLAPSRGIKTFGENAGNTNILSALKSLVKEAQVVVFLGFAFHRQNLSLLRLNARSKVKRVYATAFNISNHDCALIAQDIFSVLFKENFSAKVEIRNNLKCTDLINEYWRGLSSE